jgi:hypothetical protein
MYGYSYIISSLCSSEIRSLMQLFQVTIIKCCVRTDCFIDIFVMIQRGWYTLKLNIIDSKGFLVKMLSFQPSASPWRRTGVWRRITKHALWLHQIWGERRALYRVLLPGEEFSYPLDVKMGGPQNQCGQRHRKNLCHCRNWISVVYSVDLISQLYHTHSVAK